MMFVFGWLGAEIVMVSLTVMMHARKMYKIATKMVVNMERMIFLTTHLHWYIAIYFGKELF